MVGTRSTRSRGSKRTSRVVLPEPVIKRQRRNKAETESEEKQADDQVVEKVEESLVEENQIEENQHESSEEDIVSSTAEKVEIPAPIQQVEPIDDEKVSSEIDAALEPISKIIFTHVPENPQSKEAKLFRELVALRSTEVEQLLSDAQKTAQESEKAANEMIQSLRDEIDRLKQENRDLKHKNEEDKLRKQVVQLQERNAELAQELAASLNPRKNKSSNFADENSQQQHQSRSGKGDDSMIIQEMKKMIQLYSMLTSIKITVDSENGVAQCVAMNKAKRKAVKFELSRSDQGDAAAKSEEFKFRPTGNLEYLPEDCRKTGFFLKQDAPLFFSAIISSLFE